MACKIIKNMIIIFRINYAKHAIIIWRINFLLRVQQVQVTGEHGTNNILIHNRFAISLQLNCINLHEIRTSSIIKNFICIIYVL